MIIEVKVVPSSGRSGWVLDKSGKLKGYLKSPAQRGLANDELIKIIAKALKLPQNHVSIIAGATSKIKRINIDAALTYDQILTALGIEKQMGLFK